LENRSATSPDVSHIQFPEISQIGSIYCVDIGADVAPFEEFG
jgi:hypothetical protein